MTRIGLALSGGGSRAAAFHRGTVRGLERLRVLSKIDVVSSVSGGSVFAASWAASMQARRTTQDFLAAIRRELRQGFILRALGAFPWVFGLFPLYPRTKMLAKVFTSLTGGMKVSDLPSRPEFVFNVTVLNSGQVGKFTKEGFSTKWLDRRQPGRRGNPTAPCTEYPVALAAAASAAFPVGLPPVLFERSKWFSSMTPQGPLEGHETLALTDGGVLENLGAQTLLKSDRFSTQHMVISDAGTKDHPWRPLSPGAWVRSFIIWAYSGSILERFVVAMNDKQSRWVREVLFATATAHLSKTGAKHRNVLMVRLGANWEEVVGNVPEFRLSQLLTEGASMSVAADELVERLRVGHPGRAELLAEARDEHGKVQVTFDELNAIGTAFFALSDQNLDALEQHAYWQTLAMFAIYWEPWPIA